MGQAIPQTDEVRCSRLNFEENNNKIHNNMEELKLKREAYINRLRELREQKKQAATPEALKEINRKIRYVEHRIAGTNKQPERRDYTVKTKFVFEGEFRVYATSKEEAKRIVNESCGTVLGQIQTTVPNVLDYIFPIHPQKIVR